MQSFPGRMIASYELKHQIGSGSFAVVWEAVHRETGQVVALKEIKMDKLNAKLRDNLKSEVAILQQIHHRNIVRLLDVMQVRGAMAMHTKLAHHTAVCPWHCVCKAEAAGTTSTCCDGSSSAWKLRCRMDEAIIQ